MMLGTRTKIQELEKELIDLSKEPGALLKTLTDIEKTDISQEDIMNSQLAGLLMESIRPLYDTTTQQGRITRRLLAKYSDLLRTGVEDWEPLDLTTFPPSPPKTKRTFRDIFKPSSSNSGSSVPSTTSIGSTGKNLPSLLPYHFLCKFYTLLCRFCV